MKKQSLTKQQSLVLSVATLASILVILILFSTFATSIISGAIAAFIFWPVQQWFKKHVKSTGRATILTMLFSFLVVFIPLTAIIWMSINQVELMINDLTQAINNSGQTLSGDILLERFNEFLYAVTDGRVQITVQQIEEGVLNIAKSVAEGMLNFLTTSIGGIASTVTSIIIFAYVYSSLLVNGVALLNYLKKLNPLGENITTLYLNRAGLMTKSMVVVQLLVAVVQGVIGALSLQIAGMDYFVFFAVILSVLSIIPLGGGVITIPIGIVMLLTGNIFGGIVVLGTHFIIVTNIDNILKAKLLSKDLRLHPALAMIAILSGIAIFGFIGLIIGPVLMILALTTLETYMLVKDKKISEL